MAATKLEQLGDISLLHVTADGCMKRVAEVIGMTSNCMNNNWTVVREFVDLIDLNSYSFSGSIIAYAVLKAVQELMPESAQIFFVNYRGFLICLS